MSADRKCPNCGAPLAGDAPEGNCPNCLLQLALSAAVGGPVGPMLPGNAGLPPGPLPGDRIGRYKLLQQIGEGGCGVVYMAEQEEPVRRRVALKIIKLGMDTKHIIARFEAERQALALMDHPNIAKVLDAGATDTGRPFFVMELVRGTKLTDYCDHHQLPLRARLDLFVQVCRAIQHAHQKGIIHRDIKPSNILVTMNDGVPMPKVIDFGIAKATTDQPLTDKTVFTAFEQFLGTPAYMSPEQAEMSALDIDTRSDIYALGVLLYELLSGQTPFDTRELVAAGWAEMRRTIMEREPAAPSSRLKTMAAAELTAAARRRQAEPARLANLIRGDLDWIVMKALEKDRTRRYETVNGLAMDVQRYLANEPVLAGPPTRLYQMQKMVRRNKLAFAAATAVLAALVIGLGASTYLYVRENEARRAERKAIDSQKRLLQRAEAEEAKSRQVSRYLKGLLEDIAPSLAKMCHPQYVRGVLEKAGDRVDRELENQPEVEAEVRTTFGLVHAEVGQFDKAAKNFKRALLLRESRPDKNDADLAFSFRSYVDILWRQHKTEEIESFLDVVPPPAEGQLPMTAAVFKAAKLALEHRGETNAIWGIATSNFPGTPNLVAELTPQPAEPEANREGESPVLKLVGQPMPGNFKLPLLEGGDLVMPAATAREVLLLDFCATWCAPCREAMPVLAEIGKAYAARGVRYVVVDQDEAPETIRRYLSATKLEICVALDRQCAMAKALQVKAIPTVLVVDRSNTVRHVQIGRCPKLAVNLRKALDEVLQE